MAVAAGFNHSLGITKTGRLFSWGYNRKGMLGRKQNIEYLPFEIFAKPAKIPNIDDMIQKGESKIEEMIS